MGNSNAYLNLRGLTAGDSLSLKENKVLLTPSLHLSDKTEFILSIVTGNVKWFADFSSQSLTDFFIFLFTDGYWNGTQVNQQGYEQ